MHYNIRLRIGSAYDGDSETKQYRNASFADAVVALRGTHTPPSEDEGGYHRQTVVHVVATYPEQFEEKVGFGRNARTITRQLDEPVFGQEVTVHGRELGFGEPRDATVSMGSIGSHDTTIARLRIGLLTLATTLAEAVNAEPVCPQCADYLRRREDRMTIKKKV